MKGILETCRSAARESNHIESITRDSLHPTLMHCSFLLADLPLWPRLPLPFPRRILHVSRFAVVQMTSKRVPVWDELSDATSTASGSRCVDILADGIEGDWTPYTHLQLMKARCKMTASRLS